jgi:phage shock protein PspC (stress-responsive transcriptional regulator)/bacterioferritin-associated ferredoxin
MLSETKCTYLAQTVAAEDTAPADLDEVVHHAAQCADCSALAERFQMVAAELAELPARDAARSERTVIAAQKLTTRLQTTAYAALAVACAAVFATLVFGVPHSALTRHGLTFVSIFAFGGSMAVVRVFRSTRPQRSARRWAAFATLLVTILFIAVVRGAPASGQASAPIAVAATLLAVVAGALLAASGPLYKRLYSGRVVSGVCRGLAEEMGISVTWVRLLFLVLLFQAGGFLLYLILDATMQVHPDDRAHMWRFRIARWFRRGSATRVAVTA